MELGVEIRMVRGPAWIWSDIRHLELQCEYYRSICIPQVIDFIIGDCLVRACAPHPTSVTQVLGPEVKKITWPLILCLLSFLQIPKWDKLFSAQVIAKASTKCFTLTRRPKITVFTIQSLYPRFFPEGPGLLITIPRRLSHNAHPVHQLKTKLSSISTQILLSRRRIR